MKQNKTPKRFVKPTDPDELLDRFQLALYLKRSPTTIQVDHSRRPETLPPSVKVPGCRGLRWRWGTVVEWVREAAESSAAAARAKKASK